MFGRGSRKRPRISLTAAYAQQDSPSLVRRRQRFQRIVVLGAFVLLVASITEFPRIGSGRYDIEHESIASRTVRAGFTFESTDLEATREAEDAAAAQVPITYSIDTEAVSTQVRTLQQAITTLRDRRDQIAAAVREALLASNSSEPAEEVVQRAITNLAAEWKQDSLFEGYPEADVLAVWLAPVMRTVPTRVYESELAVDEEGNTLDYYGVERLADTGDAPLEFRNMEVLSKLAVDSLQYILTAGVIQSGSSNDNRSGDTPIQIFRSSVVPGLERAEPGTVASLPDPAEARTRLRARISEVARTIDAERPAGSDVQWSQLESAAFALASRGVTNTLTYDQVTTEGARALAREQVTPVPRRIESNQIIQFEGTPWTKQSRADADRYWTILENGQESTRNIVRPIVANVLFVSLLLLALQRAIPVITPDSAAAYRSLNVLLLMVCGTLVLGRITSYFDSTGLTVPAAAAVMLVTILTNVRVAAMASLMIAILLSIQFGSDWQLLMVAGAMCFGGMSTLYIVRKRRDMTNAAIIATTVGALTWLASASAEGSIGFETVNEVMKIGLNGLICLFIVPGLLSPLERLFGITTDIQLLEYSDLNNDLLSRLAIEVPATYAHSLMLGQLAEVAAVAIGANGLLARVCAYYHDIGKLRRPEYFSENQTGFNIHEGLNPRLSARAIASHVLEGVEMAKEYHLPQPIIDGIREHHGTTLISFFYQQAKDQQKHGDVVEEDFRYPGPKPQSRETALLMICDAVESGVRSIKNPNEERVREFIDKIIRARLEDRQFDECDLTLRKLDTIANVLTRQVMTTMHTRVAYPEKPAAAKADNVIRITGGRDV